MSKEISLKKIGRVFMDSGEYRKAVRVLEMAVSDSPSDVTVRLDLAYALSETGRVEEAKKQWRSIIELSLSACDHAQAGENNSTAYYNLGCYYRDTAGAPARAVAMFSKAIECDPTYAKAHFNLAQLSNDLDKMIEGLQETLHHDPYFEDAQICLENAREMKADLSTCNAQARGTELAKVRFVAAFMLKAEGKFGAALTQLSLAKEVCQDEEMLSVIDQLERLYTFIRSKATLRK